MSDNLNLENTTIPGHIEGTGTNFQITDSDYLNIKLNSSQAIKLMLESIPEMITIHIEQPSDSETNSNATQITLSGFEPNTTYHKYEDHYYNHVAFTSDENGNYTYTQDLSKSHIIFIQPRASTYLLTDTGWIDTDTGVEPDPSIGTWDPTDKIATLTTNVSKTIEILVNNATLDGQGNTLSGSGNGIYLNNKQSVTIKNIKITDFFAGIRLDNCSDIIVQYNTIYDNSYGIYLYNSNEDIIVQYNTIYDNSYGIFLYNCNDIKIQYNTIYNNYYGIGLYPNSNGNKIQYNTIYNNNSYGIRLLANNNEITNNNFINNPRYNAYNRGTNTFNENYWSDHFCQCSTNGICDHPYPITNTFDENPLAKPLLLDVYPMAPPENIYTMLLKMTTDTIKNKLDDPISGLNAINNTINNMDSKVNTIDSKVDTIFELLNDRLNPSTLTTGPVVADKDADSLVIQVLNTTDADQNITVTVYKIDNGSRTVFYTDDFNPLSPGSDFRIIDVPSNRQYEIVFEEIQTGVYAWTSTRTQKPDKDLEDSSFIKANTFSHSELAPYIPFYS